MGQFQIYHSSPSSFKNTVNIWELRRPIDGALREECCPILAWHRILKIVEATSTPTIMLSLQSPWIPLWHQYNKKCSQIQEREHGIWCTARFYCFFLGVVWLYVGLKPEGRWWLGTLMRLLFWYSNVSMFLTKKNCIPGILCKVKFTTFAMFWGKACMLPHDLMIVSSILPPSLSSGDNSPANWNFSCKVNSQFTSNPL